MQHLNYGLGTNFEAAYSKCTHVSCVCVCVCFPAYMMALQVAHNLRRSAASFLRARLTSLPRRRLESAWLRWRIGALDAASKAVKLGEEDMRTRARELQASMERGLQELKVGKDGLKVMHVLRRYMNLTPPL